jgi:hypothetical protein
MLFISLSLLLLNKQSNRKGYLSPLPAVYLFPPRQPAFSPFPSKGAGATHPVPARREGKEREGKEGREETGERSRVLFPFGQQVKFTCFFLF